MIQRHIEMLQVSWCSHGGEREEGLARGHACWGGTPTPSPFYPIQWHWHSSDVFLETPNLPPCPVQYWAPPFVNLMPWAGGWVWVQMHHRRPGVYCRGPHKARCKTLCLWVGCPRTHCKEVSFRFRFVLYILWHVSLKQFESNILRCELNDTEGVGNRWTI